MSNSTAIFNEEEQVKIFKEILSVPSENPGDFEESVALKIKDILESEDIKVDLKYIDDHRANVYAILDSGIEGKTILYNGHMDTVPAGLGWDVDPFASYEDEYGNIYGRGASDMKSGVASMIYAAICLKRMAYPKTGKLILFFNVDEEITNLGMKQFLREDITADLAIISEPTDLNIAIGHRGAARFYLKTKGVAGHACYVTNPDNAIEKMNKLLPVIFEYGHRIKEDKKDDFLGSALSNVTTIRGGIAGNIIPDECVAEIDRRTLPGEKADDIEKEYISLLKNYAPDIDFELICYTFLASSSIDADHEFVKLIEETTKPYYPNVKKKSFEATCEAPFFSVEKGIPTVVFGPGSLSEAHVKNEKVKKNELINAGKIFLDLGKTLLG